MTVPHYGKREPGLLTAVSPGDTLYFNFGSYNDSGDSEAMTGFAVTDIEVFKNGIATTRATDSGYSLISDTGQLGDRIGLHRFSIQLFNTSDDTGHYLYRHRDTGGIADANWAYATRALTAFALDTGIAQTVWRASTSTFTGDTGSVAYAQGRVMAVRTDTGAAHLDQGRFGVLSDSGVAAAVLDTGKVAGAVWTSHATRTLSAFQFDTGVWGSNAARTLTAFQFDTGVAQTVWRESGSTYTDTGSLGYMVDNPPGATVDTGQVNRAVWNADASRRLTAFQFDTGL